MTRLDKTVFREIQIGSKRYALGLHPRAGKAVEPLISIREIGRRVAYVVPVSRVRVEAALAYGRAEQAARREARKLSVRWSQARGKFRASLVPPPVKRPKYNERHPATF